MKGVIKKINELFLLKNGYMMEKRVDDVILISWPYKKNYAL
jgi:hypothetical protein